MMLIAFVQAALASSCDFDLTASSSNFWISAYSGVSAQRKRRFGHTSPRYHQLSKRSKSLPNTDGSPGAITTSKLPLSTCAPYNAPDCKC